MIAHQLPYLTRAATKGTRSHPLVIGLAAFAGACLAITASADAGTPRRAAPAKTTSAPQTLTVPAEAASFQSYGPWQFKVDALMRGPDGHIQALVTARNASAGRLPFTITDFDAYLIDANGRTVQRHGNLYRVTPGGPVAALVNAGASALEPGDEVRGRLLFLPSKGFTPAQLRLKEPVVSGTVNTYPMN